MTDSDRNIMLQMDTGQRVFYYPDPESTDKPYVKKPWPYAPDSSFPAFDVVVDFSEALLPGERLEKPQESYVDYDPKSTKPSDVYFNIYRVWDYMPYWEYTFYGIDPAWRMFLLGADSLDQYINLCLENGCVLKGQEAIEYDSYGSWIRKYHAYSYYYDYQFYYTLDQMILYGDSQVTLKAFYDLNTCCKTAPLSPPPPHLVDIGAIVWGNVEIVIVARTNFQNVYKYTIRLYDGSDGSNYPVYGKDYFNHEYFAI